MKKTLRLHRETVRALTGSSLRHIAGGHTTEPTSTPAGVNSVKVSTVAQPCVLQTTTIGDGEGTRSR
jgi:hypothetical protein